MLKASDLSKLMITILLIIFFTYPPVYKTLIPMQETVFFLSLSKIRREVTWLLNWLNLLDNMLPIFLRSKNVSFDKRLKKTLGNAICNLKSLNRIIFMKGKKGITVGIVGENQIRIRSVVFARKIMIIDTCDVIQLL